MSDSMITPWNDYVLIRPVQTEASPSGILLSASNSVTSEGVIVHGGYNAGVEEMRVIFKKKDSVEITQGSEKLLLVKSDDIMAARS